MEQSRTESPAMTFDEISLERSKGFVKALQELKSLRPQLYSAAEYCEKSFLNSEQKLMVMDNLKDYAVRALVNAVDHLGTVAYKLTDLFEQQTSDVSTMELKVSCINQQLLTCETYTDNEAIRQQQLTTNIPRHHKHYILPNVINKKVQFSPQIQIDAWQKNTLARPRLYRTGTSAPSTLSWHLASQTKSTLNGTQNALIGTEDIKASGTTSGVFHLLDSEETVLSKSPMAHLQSATRGHAPSAASLQTFGCTRKDPREASKPMTAFRSFDNVGPREIVRVPARSKSMLSVFFTKRKNSKPKTRYVS